MPQITRTIMTGEQGRALARNAASTVPPAGTPTGPRNPDGSFDEPVQRIVWMSPSDPRAGVTYRLTHAVDNSLALIGVEDPVADGPLVVDAPAVASAT